MPFPFDLSQIFWGLMNKTMWDCRFGNMNSFGGFNGNFMNSCWGGAFQLPAWGDTCNFGATSAGTSNSSNAEERVAKRKVQEKYNTLKSIIQDYINSLTSSADRDAKMLLEEKLKDCGSSYSEANYKKLTELYKEYKDKIQKKLKPDTKIEVSSESKIAASEFAKPSPDFKKILKADSENSTTVMLKDDVKSMELLYSLHTQKKKSFKTVYEAALNGADNVKREELKKVLQAVFKGLTAEALSVRQKTGISDETKAAIGKLLEISETEASAENIDQLYYWIRMANAEIIDSKYACLQEDFPELGKANGVEATTAELKKEGLDVENIPKQTVVNNYNELENDAQRLKKLEPDYVTALTENQLKELNNIDEVKNLGIKKAWVDNNSRFNYQTIRYIDKDGNMCYIAGVGLKNGRLQKVGDDITSEKSSNPEQIQQRSKTLDAIKAANDTLIEIKANEYGVRIFEEKNITGSRNYKRCFLVDSEGNLKEWKGYRYDCAKGFVCEKKEDPSLIDADLNDIKADASIGRSHKYMTNKELVEKVDKWGAVDKTSVGLKIFGDGYNGSAHITKADFKRAYNTDAIVALHVKSDTSGNDLGDAGIAELLKKELTNLTAHITDALVLALGIENKAKLEQAAGIVIERYAKVDNIHVDKNDSSDNNNNIAGYTAKKIRADKSNDKYRHKIINMRDTTGINSNAYMVSFKDLIDDILEEYKRQI